MDKQRKDGIRTLCYADETGAISRDLERIDKHLRGCPTESIFAILLEVGINQLKANPTFSAIWKNEQ